MLLSGNYYFVVSLYDTQSVRVCGGSVLRLNGTSSVLFLLFGASSNGGIRFRRRYSDFETQTVYSESMNSVNVKNVYSDANKCERKKEKKNIFHCKCASLQLQLLLRLRLRIRISSTYFDLIQRHRKIIPKQFILFMYLSVVSLPILVFLI